MTTRPLPARSRRTAALLLVTGAALLIAGNVAHPLDADPTPTSRFAFANDPSWVPIHLVLALGFLVLTAGLVTVARTFTAHPGARYAHLGSVIAVTGGTLLFTVFGALDGYAVSSLAERWQSADTTDASAVEAAAIALESIDSGVAAMGTLALFGVGIIVFGLAILGTRSVSPWVGLAALAVGSAGSVAGVLLLLEGPTDVTINLVLRPIAAGATVWFLIFGIALLRRHEETAAEPVPALPGAG